MNFSRQGVRALLATGLGALTMGVGPCDQFLPVQRPQDITQFLRWDDAAAGDVPATAVRADLTVLSGVDLASESWTYRHPLTSQGTIEVTMLSGGPRSDGTSGRRIRFSGYRAASSAPSGTGVSCGPKGVSQVCERDFAWRTGHSYRLAVTRLDTPESWSATVTDRVSGETTQLGTVTFAAADVLSTTANVSSAYVGPSRTSCAGLPYTQVAWTIMLGAQRVHPTRSATVADKGADCADARRSANPAAQPADHSFILETGAVGEKYSGNSKICGGDGRTADAYSVPYYTGDLVQKDGDLVPDDSLGGQANPKGYLVTGQRGNVTAIAGSSYNRWQLTDDVPERNQTRPGAVVLVPRDRQCPAGY